VRHIICKAVHDWLPVTEHAKTKEIKLGLPVLFAKVRRNHQISVDDFILSFD
jgi:hypothetical protein